MIVCITISQSTTDSSTTVVAVVSFLSRAISRSTATCVVKASSVFFSGHGALLRYNYVLRSMHNINTMKSSIGSIKRGCVEPTQTQTEDGRGRVSGDSSGFYDRGDIDPRLATEHPRQSGL